MIAIISVHEQHWQDKHVLLWTLHLIKSWKFITNFPWLECKMHAGTELRRAQGKLKLVRLWLDPCLLLLTRLFWICQFGLQSKFWCFVFVWFGIFCSVSYTWFGRFGFVDLAWFALSEVAFIFEFVFIIQVILIFKIIFLFEVFFLFEFVIIFKVVFIFEVIIIFEDVFSICVDFSRRDKNLHIIWNLQFLLPSSVPAPAKLDWVSINFNFSSPTICPYNIFTCNICPSKICPGTKCGCLQLEPLQSGPNNQISN